MQEPSDRRAPASVPEVTQRVRRCFSVRRKTRCNALCREVHEVAAGDGEPRGGRVGKANDRHASRGGRQLRDLESERTPRVRERGEIPDPNRSERETLQDRPLSDRKSVV